MEGRVEVDRTVRYRCVTGHDVPAASLDDLAEVQSLDEGARVLLCREHGAPITFTIEPEARSTAAAS